ncbi:MAG: hypothetical protein WBI20_05855 [Burkholderiaceae bacterium]
MASTLRGILIRASESLDCAASLSLLLEQLDALDLEPHIRSSQGSDDQGCFIRFELRQSSRQAWAPAYDTLALAQTLGLDSQQQDSDLTREILVALLLGPVAFEFPSLAELMAAIRIRKNIVQAARKTTLDFDTRAAERPSGFWTYNENTGFILLPGVSLIEALTLATQPEVSGTIYTFSCYRATEYVILLGIAQELKLNHPALYQQLEQHWSRCSIKSNRFHEVFLREQGSMQAPLPPAYFVPGDRTWFRNPDEASADAAGFEGSWVIYLGAGLFTNFWKQNKPYTLTQKCVEIYHWRHGLYRNEQGEECIDEIGIEPLIEASLNDPIELARIMALMQRYREERGIYTENGGAIDTTREFARWVLAGTADLVLPNASP